jgi:molecular chaperone DnaK
VLGIDLGTTYSVVAYVDERGRPVVIRNVEGQKTTPSVVLIEGGSIQVGDVALNQSITKRDHVVRWIKRSMDDIDYHFQGLNPIAISAEILKKLKQDAEAELGQALTEAVITCPAYFSSIEVENTKQAGELAGFQVREIVREPTAAAVYYGVENLREGEKVLVADLGGGTFDATILSLTGGVFRPLASAGDRQLGGHDWTMDLLEHVALQFAEIFGDDPRNDAAAEQALYDACEDAKRHFAQAAQVVIPCTYQGRAEQVTVDRAVFEQLSEWRIQHVVTWTKKALEKAQPPLTWEQIDHILLVGGSTRLRRVPLVLQEISGKLPIQTGEVDTMVALGAAILAAGQVRPRKMAGGLVAASRLRGGLVPIEFVRTAPRNLGTRVLVWNGDEPAIENSKIIPYGTEMPAERTRTDYRTAPRQAFFDVPIVEFDDVGDDVIRGTWRFTCPADLSKAHGISVTFKYDLNGIIDVAAIDQDTGHSLSKEQVRYQEPDLSLVKRVQPRCVIFALDASGSMDGAKIQLAKQAVIDRAQELLARGDGQVQVGVITFSSQAAVVCRPTTNLNEIRSRLSSVSAHGTTVMDKGITTALSLLTSLPAETAREIALVTDGMPDDPVATLRAGAQAMAADVPLCIVTIDSDDVDTDFLQQLTPHILNIAGAEGLGQALATLLTQSSPAGAPAGITAWGKP